MNRRTFLRFGLGVIGGGATLARGRAAWSQAPPRPAGQPAPAGAPGVTAREVRIGMSAAFKGTAAGLGTEFYRGAQAYYSDVNARGGVFGRFVNVVALNDGYEPLACVQNTVQLVEKEGVFFLSNYVGP